MVFKDVLICEGSGEILPDPQAIYNVLFPGEIPHVLRERFLRAWALMREKYTDSDIAALKQAPTLCEDLEALEFACRSRQSLRVLSDLVRVMAVLAETLPSHIHFFVASDCSRLRAVLWLSLGCIRSVAKLILGLFLTRYVAR